jgi:WD40 repeat protein
MLWDPATGRHRGDLPESSWEIFSVAFSPDGKLLASAGDTLMLCELASGGRPAACADKASAGPGKVRVLYNSDGDHFHYFACVAFSPDKKTLATAGWDDMKIKRWDVASGKLLATLRGHEGYVAYVAFLSDGKTLLSAGSDGDGTIRMWDVASGRNTATVFDREDGLHGLAVSPDGKTLVTAALGRIKLWDVIARKPGL